VRSTTAVAVPVTIARGEDPAPVVVGAYRNNRVTGSVYDDRNANHTRDPGEPPLAGQRVFLDDRRLGPRAVNRCNASSPGAAPGPPRPQDSPLPWLFCCCDASVY